MSTMLVTVGVVASLVIGLAAGWMLRPIAAWCGTCGGTMACADCGHRPPVLRSTAAPHRNAVHRTVALH